MDEDILASYNRFFSMKRIIFRHEVNFLYFYLYSIALYCGRYKEVANRIRKEIVEPLSLLPISPLFPEDPNLFSREGRFLGSSLGIEMIQPWSWFIPTDEIDVDMIPLISVIESLVPSRNILDAEWTKKKRRVKDEMKKSKGELVSKGKKYGIHVDRERLNNLFYRWKVVKALSWLHD